MTPEDFISIIENRIGQLKQAEAELHWNIDDLSNQSYISKEKNRRELDKITFTRKELQSILLLLPQPPKQ